MKYIYGPVQSRRLGLSLGVSLTAHKTCNFDCVYCQLGQAREKSFERKDYVRVEEIIGELESWFIQNPQKSKQLNFITLSGMGEPTLNNKIGLIIDKIRKISSVNIAVITNSSLLSNPLVRIAITGVDLIVPSLDAVDDVIFRKIDRPQESIRLEDIINGLINLRKEFRGLIWLEVMLVKGMNDSPGHIGKLKEVIGKINPDKIQLNSPVRATAERGVEPVDKDRLEEIKEILGKKCEVF